VSGHEHCTSNKASNHDTGMVLFYCTAVAMKRQDEHGIAEGLEDFFDPGEKMEFSGQVFSCVTVNAFADIEIVKSLTRSIYMPSASTGTKVRAVYASRPQLVVGSSSLFPYGPHLLHNTLAIEAG
jgi:hypothetical protein